jgi:hypothetical protein
MEEEIKHSIQKGNGIANDALSEIADLLVVSNKKIISLEKKADEMKIENTYIQNKNFIWLKVSVVISGIGVIMSLIGLIQNK